MIKKQILTLCFILCFSTIANTQTNNFLSFDFASFRYDEEKSFLEFYYAIKQPKLKVKTNDSTSYISLTLNINLTDEKNKEILNKKFNLNSNVDTTTKDFYQDLVGVLAYAVPFGSYNLTVTAKDNNSSNFSTFSDTLILKSTNTAKINISDIELASKIIKEDVNQNSLYYKNGLEITPNPNNIYSHNFPILYYYFELYKNEELNNNSCKLQKNITKDKIVIESKIENLNLIQPSVSKAGLLNVSKYQSGKYLLTINILDSLENVIDSSTKEFYIYNNRINNQIAVNSKADNYIKSEFGVLNVEECDYQFKVAKYIATQEELNQYEALKNIEAKRRFLFNFWNKRDSDPTTPENEFREEYKRRENYVTKNFGHRHKPGYKTDRGRVVLLYGIPDRIETRTNESNMKAYEVWSYNAIEGGVYFIFGDTMGISELELLHSTKRGEYFDPNWENRIRIID
ncbi:MAG: hypothetical protein CR986_00970 [Ignavibacteriae bacterium]|nr:MAG: hypothetical protein CR986_00970 [Ignavibacteriota bacterium]